MLKFAIDAAPGYGAGRVTSNYAVGVPSFYWWKIIPDGWL